MGADALEELRLGAEHGDVRAAFDVDRRQVEADAVGAPAVRQRHPDMTASEDLDQSSARPGYADRGAERLLELVGRPSLRRIRRVLALSRNLHGVCVPFSPCCAAETLDRLAPRGQCRRREPWPGPPGRPDSGRPAAGARTVRVRTVTPPVRPAVSGRSRDYTCGAAAPERRSGRSPPPSPGRAAPPRSTPAAAARSPCRATAGRPRAGAGRRRSRTPRGHAPAAPAWRPGG